MQTRNKLLKEAIEQTMTVQELRDAAFIHHIICSATSMATMLSLLEDIENHCNSDDEFAEIYAVMEKIDKATTKLNKYMRQHSPPETN